MTKYQYAVDVTQYGTGQWITTAQFTTLQKALSFAKSELNKGNVTKIWRYNPTRPTYLKGKN